MAAVVGVANQKGGVGKTTTTHNLGAALSMAGHKVLLLDLDPQANLTNSCGIDMQPGEPTTMEVLDGRCSIIDAIRPASENLDILPAQLQLAAAESHFASAIRREEKLADALEPLLGKTGDYEIIILDCPPNLGLIAQNAFRVMTHVLVPVQCEFHALDGLKLVETCLASWKQNRLLQPQFKFLGILPTFYDRRKTLCRDVLEHLRREHGRLVFENIVRDNVHLAEAPSNGKSIFQHNSKTFGAQDYQAVAAEFLERLALEK